MPTNVASRAVHGRFITIEGIDGAGKSSHIESLSTWFRARGREVLSTREPGGTPLAERLRALFLGEPMDALSEALLVFAARRDHLQQLIVPALRRGCIVICDRFTDATFAYQGAGRGFDVRVLAQLETLVQEGLQPDLTLWLDLAPEVAASRRAAARDADRFERLDLEFFRRVRDGYLQRASAHAGRIVRIDAAQDVSAVRAQIEAVIEARSW
jgi:dTMP kinase